MPRFLSLSQIILILQDQIKRYGGAYAVKDLALLSSALAIPEATYEGHYLHKDLYEQAAAYAYHICQNHPFVDGNKRAGLAAALVFLDLNGMEIEDPKEELYELMMNVALGNATKEEIAEVFRRLSKRT